MDIVLVALVLAALPIVVWRPYAGAILYTALAYSRVANLAGGLAMSLRLSFLVLAAMTIGLVLAVLRGKERPLPTPALAGMVLLAFAMLVSAQFAVIPGTAMETWVEFLVLLAGPVMTLLLCDTAGRLKGVLATAALALGSMAVVALVDPVWSAGRLTGVGGKFRDSNDFALALNMALPLLVYFRRHEPKAWRKALFTIAIPFALTAIVLTQSRGGFLTLAVVGTGWVFFSRGRMVRLALAPIAALIFFSVAPESTFDRISTMERYKYDSSARDRLSSWNAAVRIAEERPLTGVGPGNFLPLYNRYSRDLRRPHVAHNTLLQILAESGIAAAAIFALLLAGGVVAAHRLARRARSYRSRLIRDGDRARAKRIVWLDDYATALVLSLAAFAVGSQFLSMDDFDFLYLLVGAASSLAVLGRRELKAEGYRRPSFADAPLYRARPARGEALQVT